MKIMGWMIQIACQASKLHTGLTELTTAASLAKIRPDEIILEKILMRKRVYVCVCVYACAHLCVCVCSSSTHDSECDDPHKEIGVVTQCLHFLMNNSVNYAAMCELAIKTELIYIRSLKG